MKRRWRETPWGDDHKNVCYDEDDDEDDDEVAVNGREASLNKRNKDEWISSTKVW